MVLGLKPVGKPTKKENYYYKFWTEPRPYMVLGLKPVGKPTKKENYYYKFWDRTKALYGPRTQANGRNQLLG